MELTDYFNQELYTALIAEIDQRSEAKAKQITEEVSNQSDQTSDKGIISQQALAKQLGCTAETIRNLRKKRILKGHTFPGSRTVYFFHDEVEAALRNANRIRVGRNRQTKGHGEKQ